VFLLYFPFSQQEREILMPAPSFFDFENRQKKLMKLNNFYDCLNNIIDWEQFRQIIDVSLNKSNRLKVGRPPYDSVLMFKILVIQKYSNLSDEKTEYAILNDLTFMRFLGLHFNDNVPDARTIWLFREKLQENVHSLLFEKLNEMISSHGLRAKEGQIIDATFVQTPKQHMSKKEYTTIKQGKTPEEWSTKKTIHKDKDARYTKKGNKNYYGYKNHICIDKEYKIIRLYNVTPAHVHDSQEIFNVIDQSQKNRNVWADSAYRSSEIEERLSKNNFTSQIHERAYKNKPLTQEQHDLNKVKSKTRARIEHVFGHMHTAMNGKRIRTIGLTRAKFQVMLQNLCYNMARLVYLLRTRSASA
jgi:IS5 family transposase